MNLEVISSNPTKNGNFCNKLQAKVSVPTEFGDVDQQVTYFLFTNKQNEKGMKADLDLDKFDVVMKDYKVEDPESELNGETISLKYLYPKRA